MSGVIVGKYRGDYLMACGQQFILLAAPTRSGKGVGVVIPNLLDYPDSVVVFDLKLENFRFTSAFRARHGHERNAALQIQSPAAGHAIDLKEGAAVAQAPAESNFHLRDLFEDLPDNSRPKARRRARRVSARYRRH